MRIIGILGTFAASWLVSCGQAHTDGLPKGASNAGTAVDSPKAKVRTPSDLRAFLLSQPGTYGWQAADDSIMLDFLADGRLHIQGPDGEASMWEGHWGLHDDGTLTLFRADLDRVQTLPVARQGDSLRIGGKRYTRYRP